MEMQISLMNARSHIVEKRKTNPKIVQRISMRNEEVEAFIA